MRELFTKTSEEIETIADGGKILRDILHATAQMAIPGVSTKELSNFAEAEIKKAGGVPSFIGYGEKKNPFPAGLCTSVNDVVVHGIPRRNEILREGDIVGLDIGMQYKGLFTDTAITVPIGKVKSSAMDLIETTKRSLADCILKAKPGNRIGDISAKIQEVAEKGGYSVVRDLVGHGVGYAVHEDPPVPCYGKPGTGIELVPNMVLAIEPMLNVGSHQVYFDRDGWTIRTMDGKLSAHFEHTIAITEKGARILT